MNPHLMNLALSNSWLWQALGSRLSLACLALILAAVAAAGLLLARLAILARRSRPVPLSLHADQRGTAMVEFALVFPILLFLILLLTQTTLVMAGNLFVHYAAFCATRAAIVQIPAYYDAVEPENTVIDEAGMPKHEAIREAAAFALIPAAGRLAVGQGDTDAFVRGLETHFNSYGRPVPNWVNRLAADRLRYVLAPENTRIAIMSVEVASPTQVQFTLLPQGSPYAFGPRDPVAVRLTHQLNLSVPYINRLFADGHHSTLTGSGRYTLVTAQSMLTNEGVVDALPLPPALPRNP